VERFWLIPDSIFPSGKFVMNRWRQRTITDLELCYWYTVVGLCSLLSLVFIYLKVQHNGRWCEVNQWTCEHISDLQDWSEE